MRKAGSHEELLLTLVRDTLAHGGNVGKVSLRRLPAYRNLTGLQLVVVNEVCPLTRMVSHFFESLPHTYSHHVNPLCSCTFVEFKWYVCETQLLFYRSMR